MKIAFSSSGKDRKSNISEVFGRCPYFLIMEIEDKKVKGMEAVENPGMKQTGGAGISSAQLVAEKGAAAVIAGNIGPRALDIFRQFDIKVYKATGPVKDAIEDYIGGKLLKI